MKRFVALLALLLAASPLFAQSFTTDQILAKLDEKAKVFTSVQASIKHQDTRYSTVGIEESGTLSMDNIKGSMRVMLDLKQPEEVRRLVQKGKAVQYFVVDNEYQEFKYDPKSEMLAFLLLGFGTPAPTLKKGYKAEAKGRETLNGVNAVVLGLQSIDKSTEEYPSITLWLDPATWTPIQLRVGRNAKRFDDFKYSNVKLNGKLSDSAFDLKMKSGAKKK